MPADGGGGLSDEPEAAVAERQPADAAAGAPGAASATDPLHAERLDRLRRVAPALALIAGLLLLALLRAVPPGPGSPYPRCTFRSLTGLYCPGCGTARCLAAISRGDLRQAFAWNALTATLAPVGFGVGVVGAVRALRRAGGTEPRERRRLLPRWAGPAIALAVLGFGLLRNLPFWPFSLLAPRALGAS